VSHHDQAELFAVLSSQPVPAHFKAYQSERVNLSEPDQMVRPGQKSEIVSSLGSVGHLGALYTNRISHIVHTSADTTEVRDSS
jgi:hypothetical protein